MMSLKNAPSFDIAHLAMTSPNETSRCPSPAGSEVSVKREPPKTWEVEVRKPLSSRQWLCKYGLHNNHLDLNHVLPSIGFRLRDAYDPTLKHPVSPKYSAGLFTQVDHNGYTYNVTSSKSKLKQVEKRLLAAIYLYRRRLDWLTSESRRTFGVIEEKSVVIVLDLKNLSPQQFNQCLRVLERVLEEQVLGVNKFNLIRAAEDMAVHKPSCVTVSHDSIQEGISWLWELSNTTPVSRTAACEAVVKALSDRSAEAVYLFTEGSSVDGSIEILRERLESTERKIPVHVVSYNCTDEGTIQSLADLAHVTSSRFHAYAVTMELDTYECDTESVSSGSTMRLRKKYIGGVPAGAGIREDALLVFNELEEARNVLSQIQGLLQDIPEPTVSHGIREDALLVFNELEEARNVLSQIQALLQDIPEPTISHEPVHPYVGPNNEPDEQYMASKTWLEKFGLRARNLSLMDNLCSVAFTHKDGVIDVGSEDIHGSRRSKLVNARYCEKFPVIKWKDGRIMHVQVTPEVHRKYEERMMIALNRIQQRISWLRQGSRELFGTVLENQIYILIDTSSSMTPHFQFVKNKLFILMQEQLRHKMKFNMVSYNCRAAPWRDQLMDVSEHSMQLAWSWVQGLSCNGTTNTYSALQVALDDKETEAIYLLTDGRPDQPPKSVIAQVQMKKNIPIHTISFNCNDVDANEFLCELASVTGGRYHYYNDNSSEMDLPDAYESEDIRLLKDEYTEGMKNVEKMKQFRDECSNMCWKKHGEDSQCTRNHVLSGDDKPSAVPSLPPKDLYRCPLRPKSAPPRPTTSISFPQSSSQSRTSCPQSSRMATRPLTAGHTRTSLLRLLNSTGSFSSEGWLLPETQDLFRKQQLRHQQIVLKDQQKSRSKPKKYIRYTKLNGLTSRQWLEKHGLVARKLTILDALAPTIVSHKAKYVPVLNKHILAKVFNDVLPLAHVSTRNKKEIKLVNPNGVDLHEYEDRLKTVIGMYKKRLDVVVWKALPEEVKCRFAPEEPVTFDDHRDELTEALNYPECPRIEADVKLLEKEIGRAEKFLQLSQDLRKAANSKSSSDSLTNRKRALRNQTPEDSLDIIENDSIMLSNMTDGSLTVATVSKLVPKPIFIHV